MYISKLSINNFRNFHRAEFNFNKGVNTLLGENASGKSNAFHALRLLLDDSLSRSATKLKESDFCRKLSNWKGHWIIISIELNELSSHESIRTIKHLTGKMSDENEGKLSLYFRPSYKFRRDLYINNGDPEAIEKILSTITIDDYETILTGRASVDFLNEQVYLSLVGDFKGYSFPNPDDEKFDLYGTKVFPIYDEVSFTFIKALRDVVSDLKNHRVSPLLALLKNLGEKLTPHDSKEIVEKVTGLNTLISGLDEVTKVSKGVQNTLNKTIGYTFSPLVGIESSLPEDIEELVQKLSLVVGDNYNGVYKGDISELSLGGANLIYMALKLYEYEVKQSTDKAAQILLIEEPEAHIHTHIQKTLFEKYSGDKTQVFLTTHSAHISSVSKISNMNILSLQSGIADVFQPYKGLDPNECSRIERYLNATRSTLLFAKGVILVEGDAELILIPAMVKKVFGLSLDELGLSLISMDSAFFDHISKLFHNLRIRKRCAIITDLDSAFVELPEDSDDDDDIMKGYRNSEIAGTQRKVSLDTAILHNNYISAHYAKHTFEVDFLKSNNALEYIRTLSKIYTRKFDIDKSKGILKHYESSEAAVEVLRLAKKEGKGWLSLLVSEEVNSLTFIPDYILKAIAFALDPGLSDSVFKKMCDYRLNNDIVHDNEKEKVSDFFKVENNDSGYVEYFMDSIPEDDLSKLINYFDGYKS
ncbi:recombination protein F [Citrobacter koseri]|uniref:Recombination protein F n=1 Tax=Citrobacter koseri TaxID=545 RepID=A0A2X2VDW2_CITKO|nr:recombination protein F [Citrobacter koseri]HCR3980208.1 AAA family ATPase [Citrobacter koseri]